MSSRRSRGLTLVEVLVALAILGMISLLAYRALDTTMLVRDRVSRETEQWRELSFFFDRLREDVDQVAIRGPILDTGKRQAAWVGGESSLDISSYGSERHVLRRIQYRWRDNAVELRLWPTFDSVPGTSPEIHSVVHSVRSLRFGFLDPSRRWVQEWPLRNGSSEVPLAVRVELTMVDGTRISRLFSVH